MVGVLLLFRLPSSAATRLPRFLHFSSTDRHLLIRPLMFPSSSSSNLMLSGLDPLSSTSRCLSRKARSSAAFVCCSFRHFKIWAVMRSCASSSAAVKRTVDPFFQVYDIVDNPFERFNITFGNLRFACIEVFECKRIFFKVSLVPRVCSNHVPLRRDICSQWSAVRGVPPVGEEGAPQTGSKASRQNTHARTQVKEIGGEGGREKKEGGGNGEFLRFSYFILIVPS